MKILILGAGGFLGQAIAPRLAAEGHAVTGVVRDTRPGAGQANVEYVEAILDDTRTLTELARDADCVLHLAWDTTPGSSVGQPTLEAVNNLLPTFRLLEALGAPTRFPFVFVSSAGAVYDDQETGDSTERSPLNPRSYYGAAKLAAEMFLRAYSAQTGNPVVVVRPSNVYGPGQAPKRGFGIVPTIMRAITENRPFRIWGDGEATRDYLYIDDFAAFFTAIAQRRWENFNLYNLAAHNACSINRLCELIERVSGRRLEREYLPARGVDPSIVAIDSGLARRELGWRPHTDLETGLAATWKWFSNSP